MRKQLKINCYKITIKKASIGIMQEVFIWMSIDKFLINVLKFIQKTIFTGFSSFP